MAALASQPAPPRAADAEGVWTREDGMSRIEFAPCGGALCGAIIWLKNPNSKAHVGQQVFYNMVRAEQNSWAGQAFNPEDGGLTAERWCSAAASCAPAAAFSAG